MSRPIALVDTNELPPNVDLPCPYCWADFRSVSGEMVPGVKTLLKVPGDFSNSVVLDTED
jgi:hypothetical protein